MKAVQVRIPDAEKIMVENILENIGLDMPTAIRLFFKKVVITRSIPFDLCLDDEDDYFSEEEIKEINRRADEASRRINVSPVFTSTDEMINYLHNNKE